MDIPALSMAMSQQKVMQEYSVALLSKSLDQMEVQGTGMVQLMEQSVNPSVGQNIDISI